MSALTPLAPTLVAPDRPVLALTILVADDDADMRLYLTGCLRTMGPAHVLEAADGREALHLARAFVPDLIISDIAMPGLDGLALCRALNADPGTRAIPLLLISGETRAPPSDGDGFLAKPFNALRLRAEVERLMRGPP